MQKAVGAAFSLRRLGQAPTIIKEESFMVKIFIDPGHGGNDPGAVGNGMQEKNLTLSIATQIRDMLVSEYENAEVRMSRTGDTAVSLTERTNMANNWGLIIFYRCILMLEVELDLSRIFTHRRQAGLFGHKILSIQQLCSNLVKGTEERKPLILQCCVRQRCQPF